MIIPRHILTGIVLTASLLLCSCSVHRPHHRLHLPEQRRSA